SARKEIRREIRGGLRSDQATHYSARAAKATDRFPFAREITSHGDRRSARRRINSVKGRGRVKQIYAALRSPLASGRGRMERMRMRDIEGNAAREAASECGQRASFNLYVLNFSFFSANGRIRRSELLNF